MTIYELTADYLELLDIAREEDDEQVFIDTLEGIAGAIKEKAEGYAKVIKTLDAEAQAIEAEIDRLYNRKEVIENNIGRMKKTLENAMIATNNKEFKTTLFSFNIQKNPPSVDVIDISKIAKCYFVKQAPKLDKKTILEKLKAGKKVAGCELKQTESLRIR